MLVIETKKIDNKGRITIPKSVLKFLDLEGAEVCFDITRKGNLVLRKINKDETKKFSSLK